MGPADRILKVREVALMLGYRSPASVYNAEKRGVIPPRRKLGPWASGWLESEILEVLRNLPLAGGNVNEKE